MRQVKPVPVTYHIKKRSFHFKNLYSCSHVFVRTDAVKRPFERPYTGPFKVLERISDTVFTLEISGRSQHIAVERLKPAHFVPEDLASNTSTIRPQSTERSDDTPIVVQPPFKTYSGKWKQLQFQ